MWFDQMIVVRGTRRVAAAVVAVFVAFGIAGLLATAAWPRMHVPYRAHHIVPSGVAPPLDGLAAATAGQSFRKLRLAYAGNAIRLRRASDNLELDIPFLGGTAFTGAPWDEAAAVAHCAATSCFIVTWYDQIGSRNPTNATTANQPLLVFNCQGSLPCARLTGTQALTAATTYTPATGVISVNKVMRRSGGASNCNYRLNGTNSTILGTVGAPFVLTNSGGTVSVAADASWHSLIGVANTASSALNVDAVATTGTVGSVVTVGNNQLFGTAGTTCDIGEVMYWDNVVLSAGQIAVLTANQRSFWGF